MKKILVVDDSKTIRKLCEWIYKGLEDKIITADSAEAARQMIQSESPDVAIVDYTLPDADAYDFIASICDRVHVVMMGGTYAPFDADKAKSSGAAEVITKPFKTADFFNAVEQAMAAPLGTAAVAAPEMDVSTPAEAPAAAEPLPPAPPAEPLQPISNVASLIPPISSHSMGGLTAGGGLNLPNSGGVAPAPRRFNFPGVGSGVSETVQDTQSSTPASPVSSDMPAFSHPVENATPKTPVPSVSPVVQAAAQMKAELSSSSSNPVVSPLITQVRQEPEVAATAQNIEIDPAVLRAEVIAAVKSMLPAIVNSYLKKLIQAEVKPQLQNWVDTRVEALVTKMLENK